MRINDFILDIQSKFPVQSDRELALDVADAMNDANTVGRCGIGSFEFQDSVYYIRAAWYDGCINGDCNPATCYMDWTID